MKKIKLTQGQFALVNNKILKYLLQWKWHARKRNVKGKFYAVRCQYLGGGRKNPHRYKTVWMHRVVWEFYNGKIPKGLKIDHKDVNGDTLDCQIKNLRLATHAENMHNKSMHKNNTSGYKGVSRGYKGWTATISQKYLGIFKNKRAAAMAYDIAAKDLYGEFASLNFPTGIHGPNK